MKGSSRVIRNWLSERLLLQSELDQLYIESYLKAIDFRRLLESSEDKVPMKAHSTEQV